jgi:F0F1-type ATP synthase assembly protein I
MTDSKHKKIEKRIKDLKQKIEPAKPIEAGPNSPLLNIAFELVAGIIVGLLIGLLLDNLFDSKPLFLIICLILAIIAAFKSIWNKYIGSPPKI